MLVACGVQFLNFSLISLEIFHILGISGKAHGGKKIFLVKVTHILANKCNYFKNKIR